MSGKARRAILPFVVLAVFAGLLLGFSALGRLPASLAWIYLGTSLCAFIAYGLDKSAARRGRWRISERSLLLLGLVGGWPGALAGQELLRHKTGKAAFRRWFWASVALNIAAVVAFIVR